jgi:hypothetical protein
MNADRADINRGPTCAFSGCALARAVSKAQVPPAPRYTRRRDTVKDAFTSKSKPTAIFAASDDIAVGALAGLRDACLGKSGDVSMGARFQTVPTRKLLLSTWLPESPAQAARRSTRLAGVVGPIRRKSTASLAGLQTEPFDQSARLAVSSSFPVSSSVTRYFA